MDSHIQMPKFILKQFADNKGEFYKYEVKTGYISVGTPAATNTEKDYYAEDVEKELCRVIETPFSQKIIQKLKSDYNIILGEEEIDIIFNYLYSLFVRDPEMIKGINKNSIFFHLLDEQTKHNVAVIKGLEVASQIVRIKEDFTPTILLNKTIEPFILPTCGMYSFQRLDTGEKYIILPFSKYQAVYFIDNNFVQPFQIGNGIKRATISEIEVVNFCNQRAFQTQISRKSGYVVAHSKELLEELKNKYAKINLK